MGNGLGIRYFHGLDMVSKGSIVGDLTPNVLVLRGGALWEGFRSLGDLLFEELG